MFDQVKIMMKLMQDPDFRAFISHPKVQDVFKDPEFQETVKSKDPARVMAHPKMQILMGNPEIASLIRKVDFTKLRGGEL